MVSEAIDHMVAIVVVGVIFVATVVALPAMNFSNIQTLDQQQLRNTALNVFDSILLNGGSPTDWGAIPSSDFDQDNIKLFGLASPNPLSKFVLDSGKVQRLNTTYGPGMTIDRVRSLLNLQEYDFRLSLYRPFKVASYLNATVDTINLSVTTTRAEDGTPIPNAEVKVTIMVTASSLEKNKTTGEYDLDYKVFTAGPYKTDSAGKVQRDLSVPGLAGYMVNYAAAIMYITVGGMTTTVIAQNENEVTKYIKVSVYGDTIDLSFRDESVDNPSERGVVDLRAFDFENFYSLFSPDGKPPKITNGQGWISWTYTYDNLRALDPQALVMVLQLTVPGAHDGFPARRLVLIAGPFAFGDPSEIFSFGNDSGAEDVIAVMRRLVVISGMTYVAEIAFWRA